MTSTALDTGTPFVLARTNGHAGRVTLNRPAALNALTGDMFDALHRVFRAWARDDAVHHVVLDATGERAFCAGGDVADIRDSALDGGREARRLWRREYALDLRIARFGKPVVSLLDGYVFGGGVGLTVHRPIRVVTERTRWAMPEVVLGISPDVGSSFVFSRLPGELGTHLALTGCHLDAGGLLDLGLADAYVPSDRLPALRAKLTHQPAQAAVDAVAQPAPTVEPWPDWIDRCYAGDDIVTVLSRLRDETDPAAALAAEQLDAGSPTAAAVTLLALRRARTMEELAQALRQDYALMTTFLQQPDLVEGVRARIVDKDRRPRWQPSQHADVDLTPFDAAAVAAAVRHRPPPSVTVRHRPSPDVE